MNQFYLISAILIFSGSTANAGRIYGNISLTNLTDKYGNLTTAYDITAKCGSNSEVAIVTRTKAIHNSYNKIDLNLKERCKITINQSSRSNSSSQENTHETSTNIYVYDKPTRYDFEAKRKDTQHIYLQLK